MNTQVTILTGEPTIEVIAEMQLQSYGVLGMARWVKSHRPECLPDDWDPDAPGSITSTGKLFPHGGNGTNGGTQYDDTDNELLVELAGRKCYDSFGLKAGRKSNEEYIAHTQEGDPPHASILYHAKMSFFIAGVSRRVSHELIRNYVGADRDEEGSPSQESTRFTHHYGYYIAPPRILPPGGMSAAVIGVGPKPYADVPTKYANELQNFYVAMQKNYDEYLAFINRQFEEHGGNPKGMDRKRVYEAASAYLSHACETSFVWTTNPMALAKLFKERATEMADLEFQRFARRWARICYERWPNLFPVSRRVKL